MQSDHIEASQIRKFERQYEENPESFVFARLADAHRKAGNPERALEILERGLQRHAEYMSAHIVRARCLTDLGRERTAVEAWSRVLELDPQNLVALRALAELAIAAGDRALARTWAERLLHVDPLNEEAARLVAETAPDIPAGADDETVEGIPDRPGSRASDAPAAEAGQPGTSRHAGMITETMADLYVRQGLYEEAAYIYWELVKRQPANPSLRERLAQAQALASGSSKVEGRRDVVPMTDPSETTGVEPPQAEGPGAGDIRSHLRALIRGDAEIEAPGPDERHTETDARPSDVPVRRAGSERQRSAFGDWLRSRRR